MSNTFDQICGMYPAEEVPGNSEALSRLLFGGYFYQPEGIKFTAGNLNFVQRQLALQMRDSIDEVFLATEDVILRMDGGEAFIRSLSDEERAEKKREITDRIVHNRKPANVIVRLISSDRKRGVTIKMMGLNEPEPFVLAQPDYGRDRNLAVAVTEALLMSSGLRTAGA